MEEKNVDELLSEEIAAQIKALSDLQSGSKEKSTAIDDLTKLYKLRIEENKSVLSVVQEIKLYSLIIALAFFTRKTKRTCITHVPNVSEFPLYFFVGLKRLINPLNVEDVKVPVSSNLNPLFIQMP